MDVEMLDGRAVCPVDHHSAEFAEHHREILAELRQSAPLVWSPLYGGFWIATRFDIVRRLAMDSAGLTVAPGPHRTGGIQIPAPPGLKTRPLFVPGEADGQEHDDYRMALNPHFSKQRVSELTPMIERHVTATIDGIIASRKFDVVNDLVGPILAAVACEHLGLEVDNPAGFFQAMFEMVSYTPTESSGGDKFDQVARAFSEEWQAVVDLVADRRDNPRDDVVSHLVRWTTPAFTDDQIQMMTLNVILGASDTTKSLVSQAVLYLDQNREVRDTLRRQPELIRKSVEEFLRLFVVAMGPCRTATQDVEIAGVTIKQGERLMLSFPSANHDPAKYPDPDEFSLERGAGQHLAMGVGTHFCLGAWLAKSISTITLRELLDRVPEYVVDAAGIEGAHDKNSLNHFESMPAAITPDDLLATAP